MDVTIHCGECADDETCPAFATINTDPEGGYIISTPVTDPAILAAFAHRLGPDEVLTHVPRALGPEVFGGDS